MKKLINFLIPMLMIFISVIGCKDKEEAPSLEILTQNVSFSKEGGEKSVEVKTNVSSWHITLPPNQSWLNAVKNGNAIKISATENTQQQERSASIKVKAGSIVRNITVQQMGNDASILISNAIFSLPEEGGEIEFEVTSNAPYDVIIPENTPWISLNTKTEIEAGKTKYTYNASWNEEDKGRQVDLQIIGKEKARGITKTISITQRGQSGYESLGTDNMKDDIKLTVASGTASSAQSGSGIEKSFDGDPLTLYHSNWNNNPSNYFPIELIYNLQQPATQLDYIIYYPRQKGGNNGNFKKVEIYVKSVGGEYVKVLTKELSNTGSPSRFVLPNSIKNPESVKFKVIEGYGDGQGFASCAEMEFYAYAKEDFDISSIFVDKICSDVKPEVTNEDIAQIPNNFYRNMAYYMKKGTYPREFRIQDYKAWEDPNPVAAKNRNTAYSEIDGVTGIYVEENEKLIVFVGDTHGQSLSLRFVNLDKPEDDGYNYRYSAPLSEGKNIITPPSKGLVYVMYNVQNPEQHQPIKIHFASGKVNGYFDLAKHNEQDWNRLLGAATYKYFDVMGPKSHLLFETNQFRQFCGSAQSGISVLKQFEKLVTDEQELMGLTKYNRASKNRALFHIMYKAYMYSTSYRTAYNTTTVSSFLTLDGLKKSPWGPAHELGHTHQVRPLVKWIGMTECTVNIPSLYIQTGWGNASRIQSENRYQQGFTKYYVNKSGHFQDNDGNSVWRKLVPFWQLKLYLENVKGQEDFYKDLYEKGRNQQIPQGGNGAYMLNFPQMVSEVSKMNFIDFFDGWGYYKEFKGELNDYGKSQVTVTADMIRDARNKINALGYNKPPRSVRYISDANWTLYKHNPSIVKGTARYQGGNISLTGWKNAVAYEVRQISDNNLIFVSVGNEFQMNKNFDPSTMKVYAIAADDSEVEVTF
ncbi:hypothetical protein EDM00_00385 [Ornithobacterium rhinotracheale]|uniref:M60 family metallopeptidase n=1 Tax=Ornithobacterium rhinotracheale TaxID=28251 RepID=UPI00129C711E|nr:M60 family metallopeptidase [Ornithobacterium rhinotracheale]MRI62456.1 hypothetical protein [Ornithobacterium rhinotracheale]